MRHYRRIKSAMRGGIDLAEEGLQEAGRRIGQNYRIIRKLGHGGDGTIYLVQHCPTEQLRAAKLIKTDLPGRRRHELDMMKRLRHPALPQIYDVLEERGEFWIIMEYFCGKTLYELRTEAQIEADLFFSIARQLAEVLVYLHTRKPPVLHLDIKPSNIIIRSDGCIVLIDFGAAVWADTRTGISGCFGTPGFAAPEQWNPNLELDVRADFYGFGAVLYYCLFGTVPASQSKTRKKGFFEKIVRERNTRRMKDTIHRLKGVWGSREVASLLRRCIQEDRQDRFQDTFSLYRSVEKAERRYFARKKVYKSSAAILLLLTTVTFAAGNLHWRDSSEEIAQMQRSYDMLLEQADGLGFEQAVSCYERAVGLCPEDSAWCAKLLDRIEADYLFSMEEEETLKKLMFSVPAGSTGTEEEMIEAYASDYGNLAYRIGLMYWYFYEGTGGRSAAAKWFQKAVNWQEKMADKADETEAEDDTENKTLTEQEKRSETQGDTALWIESARIHAKIGGYYETLGKQSPDGDKTESISVYWEDLTRLWELDSVKHDSIRIRWEIAQELLSVLIMQSSELKREGISINRLQEILASIGSFLDGNPELNQIAEACQERYQAAMEALERLTESERGNEFDTEKKEQG